MQVYRAILAQVIIDERANIMAIASHSLTYCERRYSQTEREALAVDWEIGHLYLYLDASSFGVITDHKSLETILNSPLAKRLRDLRGYSYVYSHTKPKLYTSQGRKTQLTTRAVILIKNTHSLRCYSSRSQGCSSS